MSVIDEVAAERRRQIEAEGWTPEHDDDHEDGELADAAAVYIHHDLAVGLWPWDLTWLKPTTRRRDLIKAAALIVAEIERLDRGERRRAEMGAAFVGYFLPGEGETSNTQQAEGPTE